MTTEEILNSNDIKLIKRHLKRVSENYEIACKREKRNLKQIIKLLEKDNIKFPHYDYYHALGKAFEIWNKSFGDRCFCKVGNQDHFYFVRYEGLGNPNSVHSQRSVIKLFEKHIKKSLT